jgi:hypothetical protein
VGRGEVGAVFGDELLVCAGDVVGVDVLAGEGLLVCTGEVMGIGGWVEITMLVVPAGVWNGMGSACVPSSVSWTGPFGVSAKSR